MVFLFFYVQAVLKDIVVVLTFLSFFIYIFCHKTKWTKLALFRFYHIKENGKRQHQHETETINMTFSQSHDFIGQLMSFGHTMP